MDQPGESMIHDESNQPYWPSQHEVGLLPEAGEVVAEEEGVVHLRARQRAQELLAVRPDLLEMIAGCSVRKITQPDNDAFKDRWGKPGSCGAIWAFKGAAPLKGLSTFCNSLESAIFPKLRTKCKVSFFTHQRAKWHQNLWVIPTQPSNEWTLNKNFHLTVSPFT